MQSYSCIKQLPPDIFMSGTGRMMPRGIPTFPYTTGIGDIIVVYGKRT